MLPEERGSAISLPVPSPEKPSPQCMEETAAELFPLSSPSSSYHHSPTAAVPVISHHPPRLATAAIPRKPRSPLLASTPNRSTRN